MADNHKVSKNNANELLDIFPTENDQNGMDLLSMSNFLEVYIGKIEKDLESNYSWRRRKTVKNLINGVTSAITCGYDISNSSVLIADYSHFSKDIVDGLKSGIYHIGQSKEISGNLRPAILDDKEQLVKFFTLKKAIDPSKIMTDVTTLATQSMLRDIGNQIEELAIDVKELIDFNRRINLSDKFIYARDKIMSASSIDSSEEIEEYLKEADTYLMEGLISLKSDLNSQVANLCNKKLKSTKNVDSILTYINEDMLLIPRYVGLRIYILNYLGKRKDANRILKEYQYMLESLNEKQFKGNKYSAIEIIHSYYSYSDKNMDFWLKKPIEMIETIKLNKKLLNQEALEVYYIDIEENNNE